MYHVKVCTHIYAKCPMSVTQMPKNKKVDTINMRRATEGTQRTQAIIIIACALGSLNCRIRFSSVA